MLTGTRLIPTRITFTPNGTAIQLLGNTPTPIAAATPTATIATDAAAESARDRRLKWLSSARGVFDPRRLAIPRRRATMNSVYWEVFGRFGRRSETVIAPYLCCGDRILYHRAAAA